MRPSSLLMAVIRLFEPADQKHASLDYVPHHCVSRFPGISPSKLEKYLLMIRNILLATMRVHFEYRREHNASNMPERQLSNCSTQAIVAPCFMDDIVKLGVGADPDVRCGNLRFRGFPRRRRRCRSGDASARKILRGDGKLLFLFLQQNELFIGNPGCGEFRSQAFQLRPHLIGFFDVAGRRPADDRALVMRLSDHSLRFELPESLSDRRSTDREFVGKEFLPQAIAGRKFSGEDTILDF